MSQTRNMIEATTVTVGYDVEQLAQCIDACVASAQACTACADACLAEEMVHELRHCITLDLNCAEVCAATARVLSRQTDHDAEMTRVILAACADACRLCGDDCSEHASMKHCQICADVCRRCEDACRELLAVREA